jgi:hypothetical protein
MSNKAKHASKKAQHLAYQTQSRRSKNRAAKLAKHLKKYPNDEQALNASKVEGSARRKSHSKGNFPEQKEFLLDGAGNVVSMPTFKPEVRNVTKR